MRQHHNASRRSARAVHWPNVSTIPIPPRLNNEHSLCRRPAVQSKCQKVYFGLPRQRSASSDSHFAAQMTTCAIHYGRTAHHVIKPITGDTGLLRGRGSIGAQGNSQCRQRQPPVPNCPKRMRNLQSFSGY